MDISYKPLWRQLLEKDMKKKDLMSLGNFSPNLLANMGKNKYVSLKNIVKICEVLECEINEVVELIADKKEYTSDISFVKPFVKWAGGKTALLESIKKNYPKELGEKINKYCEPFVGGGAVLFDILSNYDMKEVYISDSNEELIDVYKTIRNNVDELVASLKKIENEYIPLNDEKRKEYYYGKREDYNKYILKDIVDEVYGSALFIFLNRTCFNGLYRVNKKGLFNVPIGSYKNPRICDEKNLRNISFKLKKVKIVCTSYDKSYNFIDENTLVYFDPPYRPLTKTAAFTSYDKDSFDDNMQIELANYYRKVSEAGAVAILSNSDPKNIDDNDNFFDDLYKGFIINRVEAKRRINSKASKRGNVSELLITNYKEEK